MLLLRRPQWPKQERHELRTGTRNERAPQGDKVDRAANHKLQVHASPCNEPTKDTSPTMICITQQACLPTRGLGNNNVIDTWATSLVTQMRRFGVHVCYSPRVLLAHTFTPTRHHPRSAPTHKAPPKIQKCNALCTSLK